MIRTLAATAVAALFALGVVACGGAQPATPQAPDAGKAATSEVAVEPDSAPTTASTTAPATAIFSEATMEPTDEPTATNTPASDAAPVQQAGIISATVDGEPCPLVELPYPRPEPDYNAKRVRDLAPFAGALAAFTAERAGELDAMLTGKTILDIQALLAAGDLTSEELVTYYVDRIRRYDIDGLNSVLELNPQVLEIARALDEERAAGGAIGSMHGIPVLLKDNIATGDGMHAAAGAVALQDWQPDRDAFLVSQLRRNGAIILGKANLSEWANWMDSCMPNGFSALGGQTQNPYGPFETYGSSSGSAVSVAAGLTTVSVGSETQGSLIVPAGINSVVAIKTSKGLISTDYIIPLLPFQDVAGPMGRNVTDVAVLLTAMTGVDANDPDTQRASALAGTDFTQYLAPAAREGVTVGILILTDEALLELMDQLDIAEENRPQIMEALRTQNDQPRLYGKIYEELGFEVVEVPSTAMTGGPDVFTALTPGFRLAIDEFLGGLGDQVEVRSLQEIVDFNNEDLANRAPYGQDYLEASLAADMSAEEFAALREQFVAESQGVLRNIFETYGVDVLVGAGTQIYAPAGYPAMSIPLSYDEEAVVGMPQPLVLIGNYLGEPELITAAYAFEQETRVRVEPDLEATMALIAAMEPQN